MTESKGRMIRKNGGIIMATEKSILKEQLNEEYKKKGIHAILDKRRILKHVLGKEPTFTAMQTNDIVKVIQYLRGKTSEELQSNVIAWVYLVERKDGLMKKQIRKLLDTIPSDIQVFPFSLQEEDIKEAHSMTIGFIHRDYFAHYEKEIKDVLISLCNDYSKKRENILYPLSNGLQINILCEERSPINNR